MGVKGKVAYPVTACLWLLLWEIVGTFIRLCDLCFGDQFDVQYRIFSVGLGYSCAD